MSIPALLAVICHKIMKIKDETSLPADSPNQEDYTQVLLPCEGSNWDLKRKRGLTYSSALDPCRESRRAL